MDLTEQEEQGEDLVEIFSDHGESAPEAADKAEQADNFCLD